jgi:predicted DNA-binding protein YlxM (UPF0122 family)
MLLIWALSLGKLHLQLALFNSKIMTNEQKTYIDKHCTNKTSVEIADHLNVNRAEVEGHMMRRGEKPLKQQDMAMYYLYKNAGKVTRKEAFDHLGLSAVTFDKYVREGNIKFKEEERTTQPQKVRESFNDKRILAELMEGVRESYEKRSTPHFKDKYTQSHSPYGFADELKEIRIEIV